MLIAALFLKGCKDSDGGFVDDIFFGTNTFQTYSRTFNSFENLDEDLEDFYMSGDADWDIDCSTNIYEHGSCILRSGDIDTNEITNAIIYIDFNSDVEVSFRWRKTNYNSSSSLKFYINGITKNLAYNSIGPVDGWYRYSYQLSPGFYELKWEYEEISYMYSAYENSFASFIDMLLINEISDKDCDVMYDSYGLSCDDMENYYGWDCSTECCGSCECEDCMSYCVQSMVDAYGWSVENATHYCDYNPSSPCIDMCGQ